jgi:NADPH oxidase
VAALTRDAMKGGEREKETAFEGSRGDFVELDSSSITRPLPVVRIDGPYGAPAEDVFNVEIAVLVGAGIGMSCRFILILRLILEKVLPPSPRF